MKTVRTTKVKVLGGEEHFEKTLVNYLRAANWGSKIVFKTKELNSNHLHRLYYATVRRKFKIGSQLTCSLFKQITASYQTQKSLKKWTLSEFKKPVMPLVHNRNFSRTSKGATVLGEKVTLKHPRIPEHWRDSKLKRIGKTWFLLLCHEIEIPEPKQTGCIVGVDFGVNRLMVATNSNNSKTFFFQGGELNHRRCCIRKTRALIQAVGTRSAHRLLQRMSRKEAAVTEQLLHVASKALVRYAVENGARRIIMEDLSNIRDSSLKKGKDLRSKIHRWPYANGQFKIAYKAMAMGIETEKVNPKNTSRGCYSCGYVSESNRKGFHFQCKKCNHREDADRHASRNIRQRSVLGKQVYPNTGSYKPPENSESLEINTDSTAACPELVLV